MKPPVHLPKGVFYNEQKKEWQLGKKNAAGKPIGQWKIWHEQGHLCAILEGYLKKNGLMVS